MMRLDIKAIGIGLLIFLLIGSIGYIVLAFTFEIGPIAWAPLILPYIGIVVAGSLTSHRAHQAKLFNALILSFPIAAGFGLFNYVWSVTGMPTDLIGLNGALWASILSLPISLLLCASSARFVIWKYHNNKT